MLSLHSLAVLVVVFHSILLVNSTMLPGGKKQQDANDPAHMEKIWKGVKGLNEGNNSANHYIPIKVLKVDSQVVSGSLWTYEVLVGESTSSRGEVAAEAITKDNTSLKANGSRAIYKVTVWEKPWENFEEYIYEKIRDVSEAEVL